REDIGSSTGAAVVASVLTAGGKAAIVQGRQPIRDKDLDDLAKTLAKKGLTVAEAEIFGKKLAELVLAPAIREVLVQEVTGNGGGVRPLVIVHDAPMSRVAWETLRLDDNAPALTGGITHRYDGGSLSVAKWRDERANTPGLNILLVVNPTGDLPGAEKEGAR